MAASIAQGSHTSLRTWGYSLGLVHSRKGKYVSDETLKRRRKRIRRNRAVLEHCIATNELGQEYTLQQLAELSVSVLLPFLAAVDSTGQCNTLLILDL